jgi:2-amino-4-hydroxy-6-hydroxymethyldihydropteridine diphosphokinase
MSKVFFSIGSNKGNRLHYLHLALDELKNYCKVDMVSSIYETAAYGVEDQPNFYNIVCSAQTDLSPTELIKHTKQSENIIGREKSYRWGPREIDIDILDYENISINTDELILPHKEFHLRNFVLIPFNEIASHYKINEITIEQYLKNCSDALETKLIDKKV